MNCAIFSACSAAKPSKAKTNTPAWCKPSWANISKARAASLACRCTPPGSPFQRRVWNVLQTIPYGGTTHYQALAEQLGNPAAVRAVAAANGANRLSILIPCHRVIGKDGSLTGYGGGLQRKQWLLDHEQGRHQVQPDWLG